MNEFSLSAATWLWDYYLLATALLAVALVANAFVRQPVRRRAIAWATVCGLMALALFCAWPSWARVHLLPPPPAPPTWTGELEPLLGSALQEATLAPTVRADQDAPSHIVESVAASSEILVIDFAVLSFYLCFAGSLLVASWLVLGAWQVRRLRAQAIAPPEQVLSMFRDLTDSRDMRTRLGIVRLPVPVAIGLWRPMILLPGTFVETVPHAELRTVLAHELAHVRHHDLWLLAAVRGLLVVLWAHPLFWLLRRRVRLDQELLADAAAAEVSNRADYAEQLVQLARACTVPPPRLASSVGLWESSLQLKQRITVLLDEGFAVWQSCSRRWRVASGTLLVLATLALSLVTLQPNDVAEAVDTSAHASNELSRSRSEAMSRHRLIDMLQITAEKGVIRRVDVRRAKLAPWVPDNLTVHAAYSFDPDRAVQKMAKLFFDEQAGYAGALDDVLEAVERDPYGPMADVEKEFISKLSGDVAVLVRNEDVALAEPRNWLVLARTRDAKVVSTTVDKFMSKAPECSLLDSPRRVWMCGEKGERFFVCVASNHLFITRSSFKTLNDS